MATITHMAKKKNSPGRPRVDTPKPREGKPLHAWISEDLFNAFEKSREINMRSKKNHLEFILKQFLENEGLYPPKTKEQGDSK